MSLAEAEKCPVRTARTNPVFGSVVDVTLTCYEMWSHAQKFAYTRLATREKVRFTASASLPPERQQWEFIPDPAKRARIIAATYANLYLEQELSSEPKKKGRFYWAALAAFASKTVACSLENLRVKGSGQVSDILGQGNFWLFMDIAPWHWYYMIDSVSFADCAPKRDVPEMLCKEFTKIVNQLPWAKESLPVIKNLKVTAEITKAFALVGKIEKMKPGDKARPALQLEHLMEIAKHEQGNILQPLVYKNNDMVFWLKLQRSLENPITGFMIPDLEIVFTHACSTNDAKLKSVAPKDTVLEDYRSRMRWIRSAAEDFHKLMLTRPIFMEQELQTISGWWQET